VGGKVSEQEELSQTLLDKWKMMLFGIEKSDYVYRRSVGLVDEK
jgi:hypothetical protein